MVSRAPRTGTFERWTYGRAAWLAVFGLALGATQTAQADGEDGETPEVQQQLASGEFYTLDPIPVSPENLVDEIEPAAGPPYTNVLFLNFDGETLGYGNDDSSANTTFIQQLAGPFAAYGAGNKRAATIQAVMSDWAAYNVVITDQRPNNSPYTMCMTGPTNPFGGGVLGIAPLDCNDQMKENIVFAFHSANDQFSADTQATTISQEIAHAYGLEHVNEANDIMNPYNAGGNPSFKDQCISIVPNQGQILCTQQHQQLGGCAGGTSQNSHQELLAMFGAAAPDNTPPTVSVTYPSDGQTFDVGASFEITVDASDDQVVDNVEIFVNGTGNMDNAAPYALNVQNIPAGSYTVYAVATDSSQNTAQSSTITFHVDNGAPATTDDSSTSGPDPTDTDSTSGSDSGTDSGTGEPNPTTGPVGDDDDDDDDDSGTDSDFGALPPGYGDSDGFDEGCGCLVDGGAGSRGVGFAVLLLALGLRRRPRARA
ncbi:MAG: Ig-like domain-containing protein [Myxococcales bacterium]|nr:Ig-like domain-containing protein [Myxococcales bacterium]